MYSVTARIKSMKQPRGGYIKPSHFEVRELQDQNILNEQENINAGIVGLAVDYLTRLNMGTRPEEAFKISLIGASCAEFFKVSGSQKKAKKLLSGIKGLNNKSIVNACKLATFDVWFRNTPDALKVKKNADDTNPDKQTIENIRIMVRRSLSFWEEYGPIVKDGFTFEPNGYTETVSSGDGDYLTADTLWDFKVSKNKLTNKHTLQLLMYWIMGQHSGQDIYKDIENLGIFNPRLNTVYLLATDSIPRETIEEVEKNVICY